MTTGSSPVTRVRDRADHGLVGVDGTSARLGRCRSRPWPRRACTRSSSRTWSGRCRCAPASETVWLPGADVLAEPESPSTAPAFTVEPSTFRSKLPGSVEGIRSLTTWIVPWSTRVRDRADHGLVGVDRRRWRGSCRCPSRRSSRRACTDRVVYLARSVLPAPVSDTVWLPGRRSGRARIAVHGAALRRS